jgi:H+-transporting ATPase
MSRITDSVNEAALNDLRWRPIARDDSGAPEPTRDTRAGRRSIELRRSQARKDGITTVGRRPGDAGGRIQDARSPEDRRHDEALDERGLSSTDAEARLGRYGPNAVEEHRPSLLLEIGSHFWGPIPWMIEAALLLTAVTARWTDFAIILALLLLNGVVGFWEEHQARGAIEALEERMAKQARVMRDGAWITLDAAELVPGDLVTVERGGIVPADATIVRGTAEADESALTGESLPVDKGAGDALFSGSIVTRGGPVARVLATGAGTLFGRTAELAKREPPPSHLQRAILSIGRYLITVDLVLVGVIVVVSLMRGTSATTTLEFALVVTIASVPVALPAVLSVTMAVGARDLATRDALVSHLPALEEMAGMDVLCTDKTGTITKNELAVADVVSLGEERRQEVLVEAALTAEPGGGDPIDHAVLQAIEGVDLGRYDVLDLTPFDPTSKRAQARVRDGAGREFGVAKGAVQAITDLVGARDGATNRVSAIAERFASKGYRALTVARSDDGAWRMTGVLGLQDPPRDDSRPTLRDAERLGMEVKMVTGDRVEIAGEIAAALGMGSNILEADVLRGSEPETLADRIEDADGFAEVVPEDKFRIVEMLQGRGHIVGMTGDGVNDVPALERADAGIAVSGATDAARAAADIVLLAPGLSTIIDAVHRAREVFQRMKNYAIYRITETIRVVLFVTVAILAFDFYPVTPIQVVLLAILNDGAILAIAYDRVRGSSQPVRWDLREILAIATVLGAVGLVASFGFLWLARGPLSLTDPQVQTLLYLKLSVAGHLTVFVARTHGRLWSYRPSWLLIGAVIGTQLLATLIAVSGLFMAPIGVGLAALAWIYALAWMLVLDQVKVTTYAVLERHGWAAPELTDAVP